MKIAFIGCGNMGECILNGLIESGRYEKENICVFNRTAETVRRLVAQYGVKPGNDAADAAAFADVIIVGVKPFAVCPLLESLRDVITEDKIVVSIAAAISMGSIEKALLHTPRRVVRAMPNVPARVCAGLTSVTANAAVTRAEMELIVELFGTVGRVVEVSEAQIHAVVGVAGSSPAYVFMFMEAMADAAVHGGLPRTQAYELAAQAVLGSALLLQKSGLTPAQLKDMVCSPGGTTIEAVRSLESGGLRSTVMEAAIACMEKSKALETKLN
ncbi:putative pyrroline-5-carboxylate reductase [Trypanosoma vivax]|uniref:Pyrroline-5-carboxylate reductase n=1 Tax=Trypanosoma vivax (strain Y486) TaxID=1055687 RepID=G0TY46_TRYVY|nr:putative pyrroline-5-carboxylate reductase [Trypanosoma vivax]CCC48891.1 putative pyrroline-5-carboxylate reductase [Trypanosoma vivax Y486]